MFTSSPEKTATAGRSVAEHLSGNKGAAIKQRRRDNAKETPKQPPVQRLKIEELDDSGRPIRTVVVSPELQHFMARLDMDYIRRFSDATRLLTDQVSRDSYHDGYADRAPNPVIGQIFLALNGTATLILMTAHQLQQAWDAGDYPRAEARMNELKNLIFLVVANYRRWMAWREYRPDPGPFVESRDRRDDSDDDSDDEPRRGKKEETKSKKGESSGSHDDDLLFNLEV